MTPSDKRFHSLTFIIPYIRQHAWLAAGAVLALVVAAATMLGIGHALRGVIDQGLAQKNPQQLDDALVLMMGVVVVLAAATYTRYSLVTLLGEKVVAELRQRIFSKLLGLDAAFYETARMGDVLSRLSTDTTILQGVVGSSVSIALRNMLMMTGGLVLMFTQSPKLAGMIVLMVPLVVVPIIIYGKRVRAASKLSQEKLAEVNASAEETLGGIKTIQAYTSEHQAQNKFTLANTDALGAARNRIRQRAALTALVIVMVFTAITFILWTGGHDVLTGRISPGQLSAFIFYAVVVAGAVGAISEVIGELQRAAGAMERIHDLFNMQPTIASPSHPVPLGLPAKGSVSFDNVTFAYPARPDHPIIKNFTLTIRAGEHVALVGPSGAGKTTLFQLLLRFYDPSSGLLRFDGIDLRTLDLCALRQQIGFVSQDPVIFSGTAAENIAFGRHNASQGDMIAAAKAAHAHDFISALPQGYQTSLGEKGVRLSGGQRQRIALARAILRNPPLLLLDEATSALDSASEQTIQHAMKTVMKDRTTLIIAHRLSTVQQADRIIVLDHGQIVETGTHAQLLKSSGLYAHFNQLQTG